MQVDYGGMRQYVAWANATGIVQQFYTDSNIQVGTAPLELLAILCSATGAGRLNAPVWCVHGTLGTANTETLPYGCKAVTNMKLLACLCETVIRH